MASAVIDDEGQIDLRGLLLGRGTPYTFPADEVANLWDLAEIRSSDLEIPGRNGVQGGDDLYGGLSLTFQIEVDADTPAGLQSALDDLRAAFARSDIDLPLYAQFLGTQRLRWVRPRRFGAPVVVADDNSARVAVQLMVTDPFAYADTEESGSTTLTVSDDGLVFPVTFPVTFGAVSGGAGTFNAHNAGSAPAPWLASITGPISDASIENLTTGEAFGLSGDIESGHTLSLDSKEKTLLLDGSTNASEMRAAGVQWFDLQPGDNTIRFFATNEPPYGVLTMTWRSAWH